MYLPFSHSKNLFILKTLKRRTKIKSQCSRVYYSTLSCALSTAIYYSLMLTSRSTCFVHSFVCEYRGEEMGKQNTEIEAGLGDELSSCMLLFVPMQPIRLKSPHQPCRDLHFRFWNIFTNKSSKLQIL